MLSFRVGKIPVRITPSFFVVTVVLNLGLASLAEFVAWVAIVFGSVLAHELGHAVAGAACGLEPQIALHGLGGTTSWASPRKLSTVQRVAISLAGPLAGFVVAALVYFAAPPSLVDTETGRFVYTSLLFVNFGWGVLNLLPMLPLDGGNVMTVLLNAAMHGRGERTARIVSIGVAALAAVAAALARSVWPAFLAASFIATNWRALAALGAAEHDAPMRVMLDRAYAALEAKNAAQVVELARPVALKSKTLPVRAEALQLLAFGFLLDNRPGDADAAIAAMPTGYLPDPSLLRLRAASGDGTPS